ncbi:SDR family NAD(P)-dependent oxidoreductase [Streptomyces rugosispiralis]|uniref:SDR family oxidoreductase n=1 Tax=Streptomyces rugosispiralis TaxID=2967341 RepID=A0ABT1V002_9ACTN|nr:SDR family oxidoreductase [Streptomyces rugosispiralis]MCQ8189901.1 SDR family oxidoreductase [Streptomyces rugosispiralis]
MGRLDGRTALITGGSEGLGRAIATAFAAEGADLVLLARDPDKLAKAAGELSGERVAVRTLAVDLADMSAMSDAIARLDVDIDILVNNVGLARMKPLADVTLDDVEAMVTLNLTAPFRLIQLLLSSLVATRGTVINMSSYWASTMVADRPSSMYSATRGAIESLTRALASELGPSGVRVNAIAPGSVATPTFDRQYLGPMTPGQRTEYEEYVRRAYPTGRIGRMEEIANAALYLASDQSSWTTGVVLKVDGGLTLR